MSLDVYLIEESSEIYSANITHNLKTMADKAGIFKHLWKPEDLGVSKAAELIEPLRAGLEQLVGRQAYFESFNAPNGWGKYKHFVPFVADYLAACIAHPDASVEVST